jgi:peptidoglycan/xylan/chitin deacetylase (PgdA/CDA1 family)
MVFVLSRLKKKHCIAILFYHRFSENSYSDCELPHLKIGQFEKQMRHVKKWYKIITMDELADRLALKEKNQSPRVAITIDDGYLNSYTLAYPVLKKLKLPATIYLATGFVGTEKSTWVDELMDMFLVSKKELFCLPGLFDNEVFDLSTPKRKMEVFIKLFEKMLSIEHKRKESLMEELPKLLGVEENIRNNGERKMLDWSEVIQMGRDKISFGAHTVSHPTLSKMAFSEAKQEIRDSKREIETRIKGNVKHFAIPNGKEQDFSDTLKKYCKEIGFATVVSTEPGVIYEETDPYFLKRINPSQQIYVFACELARYMFF